MGEGYKNCRAEEVPADTVWTDYERSGPKVLLSWGGGTMWGAPFRRLFDKKSRRVQHARYINDDEPVREDGGG